MPLLNGPIYSYASWNYCGVLSRSSRQSSHISRKTVLGKSYSDFLLRLQISFSFDDVDGIRVIDKVLPLPCPLSLSFLASRLHQESGQGKFQSKSHRLWFATSKLFIALSPYLRGLLHTIHHTINECYSRWEKVLRCDGSAVVDTKTRSLWKVLQYWQPTRTENINFFKTLYLQVHSRKSWLRHVVG